MSSYKEVQEVTAEDLKGLGLNDANFELWFMRSTERKIKFNRYANPTIKGVTQ